MWVFTPRGFYSVVEKPGDRKDGMVTVRTRNKADIYALKELLPKHVKPVSNRGTDYAWRVRVKREEWEAALLTMAQAVDYSNFKDEVTRVQGRERHNAYSRVWGVLLSLSDRPKRRRRPPARESDFHDLTDPLFVDDILRGDGR